MSMNTTQSFSERVVLITGGTGPIGRATARSFVERGARVAVLHDDERTVADLDGVLVLRADVGEYDALDAALAQVTSELGPIDVLVAAAGHRITGSFLDLDPDDLRRTIEVDVRGALFSARYVARSMRERGTPGRILFLTTAAGIRAVPGSCAHGVAQAMKATLAQVAGVELGGDGITCNVIAAGWVESSFMTRVNRDLVTAATPSGRLVDPEEIAAMCLFLASDVGSGVNGAIIPVDGGYAVTKSAGGSPLRPTG